MSNEKYENLAGSKTSSYVDNILSDFIEQSRCIYSDEIANSSRERNAMIEILTSIIESVDSDTRKSILDRLGWVKLP